MYGSPYGAGEPAVAGVAGVGVAAAATVVPTPHQLQAKANNAATLAALERKRVSDRKSTDRRMREDPNAFRTARNESKKRHRARKEVNNTVSSEVGELSGSVGVDPSQLTQLTQSLRQQQATPQQQHGPPQPNPYGQYQPPLQQQEPPQHQQIPPQSSNPAPGNNTSGNRRQGPGGAGRERTQPSEASDGTIDDID